MSPSPKGSRSKGRKKAFQCIYGLGFFESLAPEDLVRSFSHFFEQGKGLPPKERGFALELIRGVAENKDAVDETISKFSQHWRLERIAKIELGILRVAVYEMMYKEDIPLKVSINEAVELSKTFGDDQSRGFVNGILDGFARSLKKSGPSTKAAP